MTTEKYREHFIDLGLNIKFYRTKKGYTQEQLAEQIHISKQQLSKIESPNNLASTSLYTLDAIADALDIDICQLISSNKTV